MPRMVTRQLMGLLCGLAICCRSLEAACPFCPPSSPPLAEQVAASDLGVLVKWVKVIPEATAQGEAQTELAVVETFHQAPTVPAADKIIRVPYLLEAQPGDLFVMLGKRVEGITDWNLPLEVTEVSFAYIKQAPSPERPTDERLSYFLKFLEFSDPTIANDAFAEFSRAPYESVVALAKKLSRKDVRRWMAGLGPTEQMRLGFYGLLLGLCGNDEDARYLADEVLKPTPPDQVRLGLDGLMGGYVLLTKEAGLQRLIDARLHQPDQPDGDVYALINCLRFLQQYAPNEAIRKTVEQSMAELLDRPAFAEVAVVDLARWGCWQVLPQIVASYGKPPFEEPFAKHKLIQFSLACVKAHERDPQVAPEMAAQAQAFLDQLQQADPETLQNAKRFFRGSTTAPQP